MATINERIAWLVSNNKKCTTKTGFAKEIGISQPFLSQICSGDRIPSDRTIADICRVFGVNKVWLETGSGEPFQEISREEKIAEALGGVLADHESAKSRIIRALALIPDEYFPAAERMLREIIQNLDDQK